MFDQGLWYHIYRTNSKFYDKSPKQLVKTNHSEHSDTIIDIIFHIIEITIATCSY